MRLRLSIFSLAILLAVPLAADYRAGLAFLKTSNLWAYDGGRYATLSGGVPTLYQLIPFPSGTGSFLIRTPNLVMYEHGTTISTWDALERFFNDPETGIRDIFTADTELGEIAPLRSGNFLVAERWNTREAGAKLIEFNLNGKVTEYLLPTVIDAGKNRALGAAHIEVLADGCTVLYGLGNDHPAGARVHRYNLCTRTAEADFADLFPGKYAGAIRQAATGDIFIANGTAVKQFSSQGQQLHDYAFAGVTHLALTTDGRAFYAAGVNQTKAVLRLYQADDPTTPMSIQLGNDGAQGVFVDVSVNDLVVVSEWRAARPISRIRAVRH
jgi:hypothetical protein